MEERLVSEKEVMEVLNLKKSEIAKMRSGGLKYVKVSKTKRLFFLTDLHEWARAHRLPEQG